MTTEQTTETTETTGTPAELNAHVKRVEAENKALKNQVLGAHLNAIGLSPEEGLGIAILDSYKGDQYTVEAVKEYAADKYKYTPTVTEPEVPEPNEVPTVPGEAATQTLETLEAVSAPATPPPATDAVADAEAKLISPEVTPQDAQASLAEKMARYKAINMQP